MFIILLVLVVGANDCGTVYYQCDTCNSFSGVAITLKIGLTQCVRTCPSNYYQSEETNTCFLCDTSCKRCIGSLANHCVSCASPSAKLQNGVCQSACQEGYFQSATKCLKCDETCLTCSGEGSACSSCTGDRYLIQRSTNCSNQCTGGTYADTTTHTCANDCPRGYFKNSSSFSCQKCPPYCKLCLSEAASTASPSETNFVGMVLSSGQSQCIACKRPYYLQDKTCVEGCNFTLHANDYTRSCNQYLNFTLYSKLFSQPISIDLDGEPTVAQIRYFYLKFTEPVVNKTFGNITLADILPILHFQVNGNNSRVIITSFKEQQEVHFQVIMFGTCGYTNITTHFTGDYLRSNSSLSPLPPLLLAKGISHIFTGKAYFSFENSKQSDTLYLLTGPVLMYFLLIVLLLTILYKIMLDPRNYMLFTFVCNMQILAMLLFIDLPHYQYIYMPFQILQMVFNMAFNAAFNKETNYDGDQLYQWGLTIPYDQYAPRAMLTAYDYFYVDVFLANVFEPMRDYQMSCNYLSNFFFYFALLLLLLELALFWTKYLRERSYTKPAQTEQEKQAQQRYRIKIVTIYKQVRAMNIRTYQILALDNYLFVTLQLAFPNFGDPYSAIAYIVSLASLFAQAWVLAHFHSKLKMILDYQDNTQGFTDFITNYSMFFSSLRASFNLEQSPEEEEKLLYEQAMQQQQLQRQQQEMAAAATTMEMIADQQRLREQLEKEQQQQINRMVNQEEYVQKKYAIAHQRQLQNYQLIFSYQLVFHLRAITLCFLLVFLQYSKPLTEVLLGFIIALNIAMIVYYVKMHPYKDQAANIYQIYFETSMLIIAACQIFLSVKFAELESYSTVPEEEMDKIDKAIYIMLVLIYLVIIGYMITMYIVSLPTLRKTIWKKKPLPPPPRIELPRFDPSMAPKIPLQQDLRFDEQRVNQQQYQIQQDNQSQYVARNFGAFAMEVLEEPVQVKQARQEASEEEIKRNERNRRYMQKYGRKSSTGAVIKIL